MTHFSVQVYKPDLNWNTQVTEEWVSVSGPFHSIDRAMKEFRNVILNRYIDKDVRLIKGFISEYSKEERALEVLQFKKGR